MKNMKKKFWKTITSIIATTIGISAITLPIVSCSNNNSILLEQLTQLWTTVNDYIIKNKVTVATNTADANWNNHVKAITQLVNNFKLGNKNINEYSNLNKITIKRNSANISFKLNLDKLGISPIKLHESYIVLEKDGTLNLNNLALSSPNNCFIFDNQKKDTILGISEIGSKEEEILFPYGIKYIDDNIGLYNSSIKKIILPDSVVRLPANFARDLEYLEYVKLSRKLKIIISYAFAASPLKKIDWYEGLEEIGEWAFFRNQFTGDLVLPKSVKLIENQGFSNSAKLNSLTIWTSNIKINVFEFSPFLKRINLMFDKIEPNSLNMNAFWGIPNTKIYVKNEQVKNDIIKICINNNPKPQDRIKPDQIVVNSNLINDINV